MLRIHAPENDTPAYDSALHSDAAWCRDFGLSITDLFPHSSQFPGIMIATNIRVRATLLSLVDTDRFFSPNRHHLDKKKLPTPAPGEGYYATTAITDHAIDFLREHATSTEGDESPFLLYVAYTAPHFPLHALKEDIAKYEGHYQQGWDVIRERRWKRQKQEGLVNCDLALRNTRTPPPVVLHTPEISDPLSILGGGEIGLAPPFLEARSDQQRQFSIPGPNLFVCGSSDASVTSTRRSLTAFFTSSFGGLSLHAWNYKWSACLFEEGISWKYAS
jgi:hypothetical protein